jgi:putative hydrolase of the HAD superfamily
MQTNTTRRVQSRWGQVEGIVFDAVGTLIRPQPSVAEAYTAAARRQGVDLDPEEVKRRFHRHFRNDAIHRGLGPHSTDEATERRRWREIVAQVMPEVADLDRAFVELWDHFERPASWRCFSDVFPALEELSRAGVRTCVGSNFDGRLRSVVGGMAELSGVSDRLLISSEVGFRKPHPEFFAAACRYLELPPERVLCVGDDWENDVDGAERAGLLGLLVDRASSPVEKGTAERPVVTNLAGLASWLRNRS